MHYTTLLYLADMRRRARVHRERASAAHARSRRMGGASAHDPDNVRRSWSNSHPNLVDVGSELVELGAGQEPRLELRHRYGEGQRQVRNPSWKGEKGAKGWSKSPAASLRHELVVAAFDKRVTPGQVLCGAVWTALVYTAVQEGARAPRAKSNTHAGASHSIQMCR